MLGSAAFPLLARGAGGGGAIKAEGVWRGEGGGGGANQSFQLGSIIVAVDGTNFVSVW